MNNSQNLIISEMGEYSSILDQYMINEISHISSHEKIRDAIKYSLISESKKLRPYLLLKSLKESGYDYNLFLNFAMSIEMIHTYSLIHDDLPSMDDDKMRRGKPTSHIKFGEDFAILAGDALLTHSFEQILKNNEVPSDIKLKIIDYTIKCSGTNFGMISGQALDLDGSDDLEGIDLIHKQKTSAMIRLPLIVSEMIQGNNNLEKIEEIADEIGLIFQIVDDYLDFYGDEKLIGKNINSDKDKNKKTYVDFYSKEELQKAITKKIERVTSLINELGPKYEYLIEIIKYIGKREN